MSEGRQVLGPLYPKEGEKMVVDNVEEIINIFRAGVWFESNTLRRDLRDLLTRPERPVVDDARIKKLADYLIGWLHKAGAGEPYPLSERLQEMIRDQLTPDAAPEAVEAPFDGGIHRDERLAREQTKRRHPFHPTPWPEDKGPMGDHDMQAEGGQG